VVDGTANGHVTEPGVKEGVGVLVQNKPLIAKVPNEARECLELVQRSFAEGEMQIPNDRVIAKQNAAKDVDTSSVVVGGKHACLNKRG
jgi:hypothetical protein